MVDKKWFVTILILFCSVTVCTCNKRDEPSACFPGNSRNIGEFAVSDSAYLPKYLRTSPEKDQRLDKYFSKLLTGIKEDSLISKTYNEEVYRFFWDRSFHELICLRISNQNGKKTLVVKQVDPDDSKNVKLKTNTIIEISDAEWNHFIDLIEQACFWQLKIDEERVGLDGATWMMEGKKSDRYYVYLVWSPENGKFREACLYLLSLSQLNLPKIEIY